MPPQVPQAEIVMLCCVKMEGSKLWISRSANTHWWLAKFRRIGRSSSTWQREVGCGWIYYPTPTMRLH